MQEKPEADIPKHKKLQFSTDIIYEANEEELDMNKISRKCHMKESEPMMLLPELKMKDEFFNEKIAVPQVIWHVFEPEL